MVSPRRVWKGAGLSPGACAEQESRGGREGRVERLCSVLGVVLGVFHPVITDDEVDTEQSQQQ